MKIKCRICNKLLSYSESVAKEDGNYLDECNRCKSKSSESFVYNFDHSYEHSDVSEKVGSGNSSGYWYEYND